MKGAPPFWQGAPFDPRFWLVEGDCARRNASISRTMEYKAVLSAPPVQWLDHFGLLICYLFTTTTSLDSELEIWEQEWLRGWILLKELLLDKPIGSVTFSFQRSTVMAGQHQQTCLVACKTCLVYEADACRLCWNGWSEEAHGNFAQHNCVMQYGDLHMCDWCMTCTSHVFASIWSTFTTQVFLLMTGAAWNQDILVIFEMNDASMVHRMTRVMCACALMHVL